MQIRAAVAQLILIVRRGKTTLAVRMLWSATGARAVVVLVLDG